MGDAADRLVEALTALRDVADEHTADEAVDALDAATLQTFWLEWPDVSSWAGALWRNLDRDLASPAQPQRDPQRDEVGGGD